MSGATDAEGWKAGVPGGGRHRGVGLACARALAAEGAEVYLGGRRPQANEEAAAAIRAEGGRAGAVYFDALKPESYAAMIGETVGKSGGRLHIWSTITAVPGPKRTRTWRARMRNIFRPTCSTM